MSRKLIIVALIAGFGTFGLSACKSEVDNKPAATVTDPTPAETDKPAENGAATDTPTEKPAEAAAHTEVAINAEASKVEWVGAKVTGDHKGGFKTFTGKAHLDKDGNLAMVSFEVDTASLFSDGAGMNEEFTAKLEGHLKAADFLDVEKFPKATFASTGITAKAGEGTTHEITGDLELRGTKKTVTFPATVKVEGDKVVADADFKINRKDFGITYEGMKDDLIKDDVGLTIHLEAPKAAAAPAAQ